MSNTRGKLLEFLLNNQLSTIIDLAEHAKINPISVRHHIHKLEAEGTVSSKEERHGVGRPRRLYFLTEKGRELFPTRYLSLTTRILGQLKGRVPDDVITTMFTQIAEEITQNYAKKYDLEALSLDERVEVLITILNKEGFTISVEKKEGHFIIKETSCPYFHVGKEHPEVCILDQTLIATILDRPMDKVQCMLKGDAHCAYISTIKPTPEVKFIEE